MTTVGDVYVGRWSRNPRVLRSTHECRRLKKSDLAHAYHGPKGLSQDTRQQTITLF